MHYKKAIQTLKIITRQINRPNFRKMLHAITRISSDKQIGKLKGNVLLTFVHIMEPDDISSLLPEGS